MNKKPSYRVAALGLDPRELKLIDIVFRHSTHNAYAFELLGSTEAAAADFLILDPSRPEATEFLGSSQPQVRVVATRLVKQFPGSIQMDRLTLQLLPILNRLAKGELPHAPAATAEGLAQAPLVSTRDQAPASKPAPSSLAAEPAAPANLSAPAPANSHGPVVSVNSPAPVVPAPTEPVVAELDLSQPEVRVQGLETQANTGVAVSDQHVEVLHAHALSEPALAPVSAATQRPARALPVAEAAPVVAPVAAPVVAPQSTTFALDAQAPYEQRHAVRLGDHKVAMAGAAGATSWPNASAAAEPMAAAGSGAALASSLTTVPTFNSTTNKVVPMPATAMVRSLPVPNQSAASNSESTQPHSNVEAAPAPAPEPAFKLRILVVDDSPIVQRQLLRTLHAMGLVCDIASDGATAMQLLQHQHYDVLLVDLLLPDTDGIMLTRRIRRDRRLRGLPVIVLTGRSSPIDHARALFSGATMFLSKPISLKDLEASLVKVLRKTLAIDELRLYLRPLSELKAGR